MALKGIDVSHNNGRIDWESAKLSGAFNFAILRTGFGMDIPSQVDKQFERNYAECKRLNIPIGAYHYSYAKTVEEAENEARFVIRLLKGKQFEYPIYFDIEDPSQSKLGKKMCSEMTIKFCTTLEQAGYWAGVYSYDSFFVSNLDQSIQNRFAVWVASVEKVKPRYTNKYQMWQYSWKASIKGSSKETDISECYIDYPTLIMKAGKNGFKINSAPSVQVAPTISDTPKRVIFKNIATQGEAETIRQTIARLGYTSCIIEEDK